MALSTVKISELSFHSSMPLRHNSSLTRLLRRRFLLLFSTSASLRFAEQSSSGGPGADPGRSSRRRNSQWADDTRFDEISNQRTTTSSWIQQWNPPDPQPSAASSDGKGLVGGSIDRIVHRLRNLGLGLDDDDEVEEGEAESRFQLDGNERLGDLLERSWNRPDTQYVEQPILPWEREGYNQFTEGEDANQKKKRVRAPWLAELIIEDSELRRLRKLGMMLRERISVPKAGLTQPVMEKIHDTWRKSELVRLKFHEALARDMKTAHKIVEVDWLFGDQAA